MIIKIPKGKYSDDEGSYGEYYQLTKRKGVKVLRGNPYRTIAELKKSENWRLAQFEGEALKRAWKSGIVPKFYGVYPVKLESYGYFAGILMEHIEGENRPRVSREKLDSLDKKLLSVDVSHNDMAYYNLILGRDKKGRKKYFVVDFGRADYGGICED